MKYEVKPTTAFKKDLKKIKNNRPLLDKLKEIIRTLAEDLPLPDACRDHMLIGDYAGYRECHVSPDWLLIYKKQNELFVLILSRTGTHSELFKK